MSARPRRAMVLAAGRGERMRPLTDTRPKPLVAVAGRTMLDRVLDALAQAAVETAVVNVHHLAATIEAHLGPRARPRVVISREESALETGGGVRRALPLLGSQAFFVANGDVVWTDGETAALPRLAAAWSEGAMDALLLVQPRARAIGYAGPGDFALGPDGRLVRRVPGAEAPFVFAGIQILHPRLFAGAPEGAFSLNLLYDRAAAAGRLHGLAHDALWLHVGSLAALAEAERVLGRG